MKILALFSVVLSTFLLVALSAPARAQTGFVLRERRLADPGTNARTSGFGNGLALLGDLNGDGFADLAAGAPLDFTGIGTGPGGTVSILFLDGSGSVQATTRIGQGLGGFSGTLRSGGQFGARMAAIGDLDGDGRQELAVSDNDPGRLYILFLNPDGTVRAQNVLRVTDPVFGGQFASDIFYGNPSAFHDVDGDGTPDFMVGDAEASDGAPDTGALWTVLMNPDGSAKAASKIGSGVGGFTAVLEQRAEFGDEMTPIGDVNGDGNIDLAVTDRSLWPINGRLWILFLDAGARVIDYHVIPSAEINMTWSSGSLTIVSPFGYGLDAVADLDCDGIQEVAFHSDEYRHKGGVGLAFLGRDGHLRKRVAIGNGVGGLDVDTDRGDFGTSIRYLGDIDGDGIPELAVGAPSFSRSDISSISLLSLAPDPIRNGSGLNPLTLSERAEPVVGQPWKIELDCSGHASGLGLLLASDRPLAGTLLPVGELLVDPSAALFLLSRPHLGNTLQLVVPIPVDLALVNRIVQLQGACGGAPRFALSNALAVQIGR